MKILAVITGMQSGGAERVMATLCNEFVKENKVRLAIIKEPKSDYFLSPKIEIVSGKVKNKNLLKSINFIKQQIEDWKPDIVLSFMTKSNIVALFSKQLSRYKAPVAIAERANPYYTKGLLSLIRKKLYQKADGCVFQTKWAQEYYTNILKCKSIIIRNPLTPDFKVEKYNGPRKQKIVCTARLSKEKNQKLLINAFSIIKDKYPNYTVEIYGEGPLREELQNQIETLKLQKSVFLMGRKNNIQEHIKDAEIFVLPSNSEGMPNALLEAMALGLACIATDCPIGGPAIIINDNENGILIPMEDVETLAKKIEELINNKEKAKKLCEKARKVINDYETVKVCKECESYLKSIKQKESRK